MQNAMRNMLSPVHVHTAADEPLLVMLPAFGHSRRITITANPR